MSILDLLSSKESWYEFLSFKKSSDYFPSVEEKRLTKYIEDEEYMPVCKLIEAKEQFPIPSLVQINKKSVKKKRSVFIFPQRERYVLKHLTYLLHKYDYLFCENLYSFRRNICVKDATVSLVRKTARSEMYSYKVDIHDYFNSVDADTMIALLKEKIKDDDRLIDFLAGILKEPLASHKGRMVEVEKGIMAGVPFSGFLANVYLSELDRWFYEEKILYARYSDDIIVFAETYEKIKEYEAKIKEILKGAKLEVNERKEYRTKPKEKWEFLGFQICGDTVDIAPASISKIKAKIRRKARALIRWRKKHNHNPRFAVRALIKQFNKKFFNNDSTHELTWCKWYFPTINTPKGLHTIDKYMVESLRYVATGKHTKTNYNLRYSELKELGYLSLVNLFYKYKKNPAAAFDEVEKAMQNDVKITTTQESKS